MRVHANALLRKAIMDHEDGKRSSRRRLILIVLIIAAAGAVAATLIAAELLDDLILPSISSRYSLQRLDGAVQNYIGRYGLLPEEPPLEVEPVPHWLPVTAIGCAARERQIWEPTTPAYYIDEEHPLFGFIVAIEREPAWPSGERNYIVTGGRCFENFATDDELAELLAEDDRRRQEVGEKRLWRDVHWR